MYTEEDYFRHTIYNLIYIEKEYFKNIIQFFEEKINLYTLLPPNIYFLSV